MTKPSDHSNMLDRRSVLISGSAAVAALSLTSARAMAATNMVVETRYGKFAGVAEGRALAFHGVPYGASTGGRNRFMPPASPAPWSGVRSAPKNRIIAPQEDPMPAPARAPSPFDAILGGISTADATESEDCLNLDIWTPALDTGKRPVMVWLHGGGFGIGAGSLPAYNGARLSSTGDVVVVNVTHRLNVLGYLDLSPAGQDFAASGMVGMLDIVAALEWVRDNIAQFGGDPDNVMIFGESGGGAKVGILMAMPKAKGLFHRAAIQSGAMRRVMEKPEAAQLTGALAAELGLRSDQAREIQAVPLPRLMAAHFSALRKGGMGAMMGFSPVLDGTLLPQHPFDPVASPLSADIPLIIGSNMTETTLFAQGDLPAFDLDENGLKTRLAATMGPLTGTQALNLYKSLYPSDTPADLYFKITTDRGAGLASTRVAELKSAQGGAPVFLYEFHFTTPVMDNRLRSPHGLEVPMVFNDPGSRTNVALTGGGQRTLDMAASMSAAWVAFARSGRPDTVRLEWPAYDPIHRSTMIFDTNSEARTDPARSIRRFWTEAGERMI